MSFLTMLIVSLLLDTTVRPRSVRLRYWPGIALHTLTMTILFGVFLALSGSTPVAAALTIAVTALFTIASNAKYRMLGEPLVFSDLALIVAVFRHPRFYFTAISAAQRWTLGAGAAAGLLILVLLVQPRMIDHLVGLGLAAAATRILALLLRGPWMDGLAEKPDLVGDLTRYGLIATLLLYHRRWRGMSDPPPLAPLDPPQEQEAPQLIIIIQCESFSDPVEIGGDTALALPGLARAHEAACQWGKLEVSGFGAYTMRTEYGVLFGRSEAALGFRRYDPFLSARGEASYALPARLKAAGYFSIFVHPHDLRFYGRDRLMPAIGFDSLVGEDHFASLPAGGRYTDDRTLGAAIGDLAEHATGPTMIYAVTMENHGPWESDDSSGPAGRLESYLRHLRSSDAMLTDLADRLAVSDKPALLVFFGDHRPSIPGVTQPGGDRHTPYVMLRFDGSGHVIGDGSNRIDLTPDALHHTILRHIDPLSSAA